jgi:hypothetical protein
MFHSVTLNFSYKLVDSNAANYVTFNWCLNNLIDGLSLYKYFIKKDHSVIRRVLILNDLFTSFLFKFPHYILKLKDVLNII